MKSRICKTLDWIGYPETSKEFDELKSFRTHKIDTLLILSGIENAVKPKYSPEWAVIKKIWSPEIRYCRIGACNKNMAESIIKSVEVLLGIL